MEIKESKALGSELKLMSNFRVYNLRGTWMDSKNRHYSLNFLYVLETLYSLTLDFIIMTSLRDAYYDTHFIQEETQS